MTDRDRLAADLHEVAMDAYGQRRWAQAPWPTDMYDWLADRLIALGWTRLDEERRVIDVDAWMPQHASYCANRPEDDECICGVGDEYLRMLEASVSLAAIAKAYRERLVTAPAADQPALPEHGAEHE